MDYWYIADLEKIQIVWMIQMQKEVVEIKIVLHRTPQRSNALSLIYQRWL